MSRRSLLVVVFAVLALVGLPLLVVTLRQFRAARHRLPSHRVIRFAGQDWGLPSPFQFYPRGPGYINVSLIFDTLTWKDRHGAIGLLARSWQVTADQTTYTFKLRPGVRWQDGRPLTAQDVAFSFSYLKQHSFRWTDLSIVRRVGAPDPATVVIELAEPFAPFLVNVAGTVPILPQHIWQKVSDPHQFTGPKAVLGSGPFQLQSYSKARGTYSFKSNPNYFLGRPVIDVIEYVSVADPVLALEKGEIDGITLWTRNVDAIDELRRDARFRVLKGPPGWVLELVFNHADPLFADRRVRRAFAHAIDRNDIATRLRHGHVIPGNPGFVPPSSPWANHHVQQYGYDLGLARRLIEEAGAAGKYRTLLTTADYAREADYLASQALKMGLHLDVRLVPFSTLDAFLEAGKFALALYGHGGVGGDPDFLRRLFCTVPVRPGPGQFSAPESNLTHGYSNQELDWLGRLEVRESNPERRRRLVQRMQVILARDLPTIALWYPKIYFLYNPRVLNGWFFTPGGVAGGIPVVDNKLVYIERRTD